MTDVELLPDDEDFTQEERDLVLQKMAAKRLEVQRVEKRQLKLMQHLQGHPVIYGLVIGVVIGRVDRLENVIIAHGFARKTATSRIRWARETNAKADAVTPFDETSVVDVEGIPVPNSRARTPEMIAHERKQYAEQIKLALAFSAQWADRQKRIADQKKRIKEIEAEDQSDE